MPETGSSVQHTEAPPARRTLVCISSIDWSFLWQGHQEICVRFANQGYRVIFIENTGVRTIRPYDLPRLAQRLIRSSVAKRRTSGAPGLSIVSPLLLPFPRSSVAALINERILLPRLVRAVRARYVGDPVILTFLPTPLAFGLARKLGTARSALVYYCIADFAELSDLGAALADAEAELVRAADLVFVQSDSFAGRFASLNDRIHQFRFGVNLDAFDPVLVQPSSDLSGLPRPILGYSGGIHRHVDLDLVGAVARAFPYGSVVLVGPHQRDVEPLRHIPNVHLLGQRPFAGLATLVAAFDVGLIPYERTTYTETVFPTKLFEYLAMGIPVVSTRLPEVASLALPAFAVRLASGSDDFVEKARVAVSAPVDRAALRQIALAHDWSAIVRRMAALIAELP